MPPATGFTARDFDVLGRTQSSADAVRSSQVKIDALIRKLNQTVLASRFMAVRTAMGHVGHEFFLTNGNYVHGNEKGHWYIFHRGGRWEPQFNIGMYGTRQDHRRYLRAGLGFNLTLNSLDPERESGQRQAKSLFRNLQALARSRRGSMIRDALHCGTSLAEYVGTEPAASLTSAVQIVRWLGENVRADDTLWVFIGREFSPDVPEDAETLADMGELAVAVTATFTKWLPVWEATMRGKL